MRQVALNSILAQIGCFVACDFAEIPLFDHIFTRIGAADDLVSGQSTFMVEMVETRNALCKSSKDSLILLDEIGRGTSTYDGVALAQSIIEYVHNNVGAKTLFSTHYHELTSLDMNLNRLKNMKVCVKETDNSVEFIHKVEEGSADKSYGIYVGELAGLPNLLINRAKEILDDLEKNSVLIPNLILNKKDEINLEAKVENNFKIDESLILKDNEKAITEEIYNELLSIKELNIFDLSPMDTFNLIHNLYKKL